MNRLAETALEIAPAPQESDAGWLLDWLIEFATHWRLLVLAPALVALATLGASYLVAPTYAARTTLLPPQQQSAASAALASLGALSNLAGAAGGMRTPADQYVALLQSTTVQDRLIDEFNLQAVYGTKLREDARRKLASNVRVTAGRKDGLLSVEVEDQSPQRAADIANSHVTQLRRLTATLALTEAQERRAFFEAQLTDTRQRLSASQSALQASGFNAGALRAEPRAAAEEYAKLRAEATAAEVRLQGLRKEMTDATPEVQRQLGIITALRAQLARREASAPRNDGADYVGLYREFKYQETLFEFYSRQFELARMDEAKEGALIQVVDSANPPERKTRPRRAALMAGAAIATLAILVIGIMLRRAWRRSSADPANAGKVQMLRQVLSRR